MITADIVNPISHVPQMDSSRTCQKLFVVKTPSHEKTSATRIAGKISLENVTIPLSWAGRANALSKIAHWATKHSSAMVATVRPTRMLENQVSTRVILCTSARGRNDRKAHPRTKKVDSHRRRRCN